MKPLFTFFIAVFLLTSCSFFGDDTYIDPNIVGTWEWQRSTGGFTGETIYRDSVDYSQTLKIESGGDAYWFKDSTLVQTYFIEMGNFEDYDYNYLLIPVAGDSTQSGAIKRVITHISRIGLDIEDDCADCYDHYFLKAETE